MIPDRFAGIARRLIDAMPPSRLFLLLLIWTIVHCLYGNRMIDRHFRNHRRFGSTAAAAAAVAATLEDSNSSRSEDGKLPGMLFPQESESRWVKSLDGLWDFRLDDSPERDRGFREKWFASSLRSKGPVLKMPVPASFNDIGTDRQTRDFVGWVWYETDFWFKLTSSRVVLRFGSVHYNAVVWLNGRRAASHEGGHLPFEVEVFVGGDSPTNLLIPGASNRLTVAVNNTLTPSTIPPGKIERPVPGNPMYPPGYFDQTYQFDFFNYAGIDRPVLLYSTPLVFIEDISVRTTTTTSVVGLSGVVGILAYQVFVGRIEGEEMETRVEVDLVDANGTVVASASSLSAQVSVPHPRLWWPWDMNTTDPAYLYTLRVSIFADNNNNNNEIVDVFRLKVGIRKLEWTNREILINDRPFYCKGVGKHDDADIRGKGLDLATTTRDFRLLKWLGANCFRTSHYPYAEEELNMADEEGVVVISESPGVGMKTKENFAPEVLKHHLDVMDELVQRDKNHPSVIMWSVANEPASKKAFTRKYFEIVIKHTKKLDETRPVTFVIGGGSNFDNDKAASFVDIICINHYFAWYHDASQIQLIERQTLYDLTKWHRNFNKSVIFSEFGAGAVAGLHQLPALMFTEDYQSSTLASYWAALDRLRAHFLVGEMIWSFADFATDESPTRVAGNRKGLFTRQRQPKMAAYIVRERWRRMVGER